MFGKIDDPWFHVYWWPTTINKACFAYDTCKQKRTMGIPNYTIEKTKMRSCKQLLTKYCKNLTTKNLQIE
jgi:hypothetical protein